MPSIAGDHVPPKKSKCLGICKLDSSTPPICIGCHRTIIEIIEAGKDEKHGAVPETD
jgi:predicted Fe-S protein YdhL (DUF1289 family)